MYGKPMKKGKKKKKRQVLMALTLRQRKSLTKHKKHHTVRHMSEMKKHMNKGKTFTEAHKLAMRKVGK